MEFVLTQRRQCGTRPKPRCFLSRHWTVYKCVCGRLTIWVVGRKWWGLTAFKLSRTGDVRPLLDGFTSFGDLPPMKRKTTAAETTDAAHLAAVESTLLGKLHPIVAHCCVTKYDDGTARKPGWITIKTMGSMWVVEAKDPDSSCRLTACQPTLDDALTLIALMLDQDNAPWENDPWLKRQGPQKGKKN